ncbi:MAG: Glu-tRNA(Gln) amidotransferase subunit GatE [Candidatus Thermoplasmatota archaeon]|nr:Glu-tRNA(Gln) amidotransferase subunit GatE [Candidatus Thermoplasmatota archaeon]MCL5253210.1 Glu-tRNA(Gln) amidotransferase subunit GatE [Candidatus Thermoplasmatota archaeon]
MSETVRIKAGLEIHQQLDTKKLFCSCGSALNDAVKGKVVRKLRASRSEMGETDAAALWQSSLDLLYEYEISENSCLVELDEEPPHEANMDALSIGLKVALLLHSEPVDEIHFMRKIVVDGSNTSGFQRTALISTGGYVEVGGRRIGIQSVCCEEDACRKIERKDRSVVYRLDRLGVPLLEIATEPDIDSPELLKETARKIGMLLRAAGNVRRGIGTIREDINISVEGGSRVEIKGVQELEMLPRIAAGEALRQRRLIDARALLRERKAHAGGRWTDVTPLLSGSESALIASALKRAERIGAMALIGFRGTLQKDGNSVIGREIAQYLRPLGVKGILHSDELPAYGISEEEKERVSRHLKLGENDAFVLCAAEAGMMDTIFRTVASRAAMSLSGVPGETRDAKEDGTTAYSRPLPGSARMYPETDVLPVSVGHEWTERLKADLPEPFDVQARKLSDDFGIHIQQATQLAEEGWTALFTGMCSNYGNASVLARILLNYLPEAEKLYGRSADSPVFLETVMKALAEGRFAKEAVEQIIKCVVSGKDIQECLEAAASAVSRSDAERIIRRIVAEHHELISERGEAALSPLMGLAMKELRGKLDGKEISSLLSSIIRESAR